MEVRAEADVLRFAARKRRDALGHEFVRQAGLRVFRRLVAQPWYQAATRLALFAAIRNEPDLEDVLTDCIGRGVRVAYPRVQGSGLRFAFIDGVHALIPGAFGVLEPRDGEAVAVRDLDLVLTPGLVFDEEGGRLGYGKGFYDRAFESGGQDPVDPATGPLRVAVCWDQQVLPAGRLVPTHSGDAPLDAILTERRLIVCSERLPPRSASEGRQDE